MNTIHIIGMGMGQKDISPFHKDLVNQCTLLIGGKRLLALFPDFQGRTLAITKEITALIHTIKTEMAREKIGVLASGDPLFHGIGATLARHIPKEHLKIHSNVNCVAAGFAAICQSWQDARIISLHSNDSQEFNFGSLADTPKAAFLTSPEKDPCFIGKQLLAHQITGGSLCVLENLGHPDKEKIQWFTHPDQVISQTFSQPNIVILLNPKARKQQKPPQNVSHETYLGMPDNRFRHSKGLITKSEVRALSLSRLKLSKKNHVLWDIGSGSGSIGIEAALMMPQGRVVAVEKHPDRIQDISHNIQTFELTNTRVVHSNFPQGHESLPDPDRIFIGGGGQGLEKMITCCCDRLLENGVIVINTVVVEHMHTAMKTLSEIGISPEMIQVQISRSSPMPSGSRLAALNPVWIVSGQKTP